MHLHFSICSKKGIQVNKLVVIIQHSIYLGYTVFNLTSNPLVCDASWCWITQLQTLTISLKGGTCNQPPDLMGQNVTTVKHVRLCPGKKLSHQ